MERFLCLLGVLFFLPFTQNLNAQIEQVQTQKPANRVAEYKRAGNLFKEVELFQSLSRTAPLANEVVNDELLDYQLLSLRPDQLEALLEEGPVDLSIKLPGAFQEPLEVELVKANIFSDDFSVTISSSDSPIELDPGLFYRGVIKDKPGSIASLSILNGEISGSFSSPQGGTWTLGKIKQQTASQQYILFKEDDRTEQKHFECSTVEDDAIGYSKDQLKALTTAQVANSCTNIYFEVDYDIYQDKGGAAQAANYIASIFNEVATLYANEDVQVKISEIFVWDQPSPYRGTSSSAMLDQFQRYRSSFNGDLAQLVSYQASGGIAVLDGLCHPFNSAKMSFASISSSYRSVPDFSFTVMVIAHELGHLFGSHHTHACVWNGNNTAIDGCAGFVEGNCRNPGTPTQGGTVMSYCHLTRSGINFSLGFGLQPGNVIRNNVAAASCLQTCTTTPPGGGNPDPDPGTGEDDCDGNPVTLTLILDDFAMETSWRIKDGNGSVVHEGGPYKKGSKGAEIIESFCLRNDCYDFEIIDTYGDGICCQYGNGSFSLKNENGNVLVNGGQFGFSDVQSFCVDGGSDASNCTTIDFANENVVPYGGLQDRGVFNVEDNGQTLYIANNAWKGIEVDYQVTAQTVIEFEFKSTIIGEIHGVGFDENTAISSNRTFKVYGTQPWGIRNYDNYDPGQDWVSYRIPVGEYYTGNFKWLFFVADQDRGARNGNAYFRNFRIYEGSSCLKLENFDHSNAIASESYDANKLRVNPNPALNNLNVNLDALQSGAANISIYNTYGQLIEVQEWTLFKGWNDQAIDVSDYANGTYLLKVELNDEELTTRFQVIND